ncbi:MAG: Si-specific NAD(P)(+) transhydrogenase [Gemmataceae bacterium]
MTEAHYDLMVIGSGPAGEKGAAQAAYFGKKVALIERSRLLGGAAANTGTLPSKTLRETSLFLSGFRNRRLEGIRVSVSNEITVPELMAREQIITAHERQRIKVNLDRHHIALFRGQASFIDAHTVAVRDETGKEQRLSGDFILIATGSQPHRPPQFPFDDPRVYDSDSILNLHGIPKSLLVVGGGVVGCEYASMFCELGVEVTLIEKYSRLLGFLDLEIAQALCEQMQSLGVRILLPEGVASVKAGERLEVTFNSGAKLSPDAILVSSGRDGNTAELNLGCLGIEVNSQSKIPVNEHYQTSVPHIYAAGDVIGKPALASTSMEQARVAMVHAFDLGYRKGLPHLLPYGIYTIPECSIAGATEEELKQQGVPYVVGRARYANNARGQIIGDCQGFLKLIFHEDDLRLLGVHMIGEQATELIHIGLTALLLGANASLFVQSCYNYPTLTEVYKYAAYDALGCLDRKNGKIDPHLRQKIIGGQS